MTEAGVARMKRNGARLFKNPPQPHMCIQDFIQGTYRPTAPCYINVLSWDKIAMPRRPSLPVPLYGGMKMPPPRTKPEAVVFAVMANPEVLRISGKNAQDPKKRTIFIELLLDFIEAMNKGIVFARHYSILHDRDITGELKEVWNAVLAIRDEQRPPQQETWIDVQPPVSQYPSQYPEQQEYTPQPPQYHSNIGYGRGISGENIHYENYGHQPQTPIIPQNEQFYQSRQMVPQYHGDVPKMPLDRYNYCERGRGSHIMQNITQHNCSAYSPAQYQFQQLPRQMIPQYINSNMHPNPNLGYRSTANTSPPINSPFQSYVPYQQQQPHMDNTMHVEIRRMHQQQQQQQQQQVHLNHVQPQYEQLAPLNVQNNVHKIGKPYMGVVQKNNAIKRQANSPTHTKPSCANCRAKEDQPGTTSKSPVKLLQREVPIERQDTNNHMVVENSQILMEKTKEPKTIPVTDLDEDLKKSNEFEIEYTNTSIKKKEINGSNSNCIIGNSLPCEEQNSTRIEKRLLETKESDILCLQQTNVQKNIKCAKSYMRTPRPLVTKTDKYNSPMSENPKRPQATMNNIIKNVFKIHPGVSGEETSGRRKTNGQTKSNVKLRDCENEEIQQGYTILKKEIQEEIASEIAQISIQDCKDTTEVSPVLS